MSYPFQRPLSPAKKKKKKKSDGEDEDEDDDNTTLRRIAREGDPLLPGGSKSASQSATPTVVGYSSTATTTTTTTGSNHHLEHSQQLRARRNKSKSPPTGTRHHRGIGIGNIGATAAMDNEPSGTDDADDNAMTSSRDDFLDEDDDDQSDSLAEQLQQQLQLLQQHEQLQFFPHQQHSMSASLSASTLTPALPGGGGGGGGGNTTTNDDGGDESASIKSYQHANNNNNDFLSVGGDSNSYNDNTTTTTVHSHATATQQQQTTTGTGTTTTSTIAPGAAAAGQVHQHQVYHHNPNAREDDDDNDNDGDHSYTDDNDQFISSSSTANNNQHQHHQQQHSAYSSLPTTTTTTATNNIIAAARAGAGAATTASLSSSAAASHQTPLIQQQQQQQQAQEQSGGGGSSGGGGGYQTSPTLQQQQQQQYHQQHQNQQYHHHGHGASSSFPRASSPSGDSRSVGSSGSQPPLLEIPEEIYAVRKAALKVLKPLTKTWIVVAVGCSMTVLFGMARWTRLLPGIPFWFILLPSWSAHVGLLWLHILSARALSTFIAEANDSRQRPDSRDHLNRTEYLPLLQRSLKFGLKTGLLSFFVFIFEILIFIRLSRNSISLNAAFVPLWILISGGILDGFICRTQHFLRVICWLLSFAAMVLLVLKVDYDCNAIRWRVVVSPVVAVLSIASANLIYIVYGHQIGYYRLTEAQLTAGNLYSLAALICIILVVMIGEVIPLSRPVEVETRLFVVILAPLVVCLVSMGAWVVSRDEFGRLLLYGGQAAVHPMKLRWEGKGWTSVQGKGVTVIPMFGEVSFRPLERRPRHGHGGGSDNNSNRRRDNVRNYSRNRTSPADRFVELCVCCPGGGHCYPYEEEEEEEDVENSAGGGGGSAADDVGYHPYLDPSPSRSAKRFT